MGFDQFRSRTRFKSEKYVDTFWAAPTPMLTEVITSLQQVYRVKPEGFTKLLELLGTVCDICTSILKKQELDSEPSRLCLRCIVAQRWCTTTSRQQEHSAQRLRFTWRTRWRCWWDTSQNKSNWLMQLSFRQNIWVMKMPIQRLLRYSIKIIEYSHVFKFKWSFWKIVSIIVG